MERKKGFKNFQKDLTQGSLSNIIVFFGEEKFLIDWACKEVVKKYINETTYDMDYEKIDVGEADFLRIEASYYTLPFFSEKRVIIIENYKDQYTDEIVKLKNDNSNNILIILAASSNLKILNKIDSFEFPRLERREVLSFIEKRFKLHEVEVNKTIVDLIAKESGYFDKENDYNLYNLEGELLKIIAFLNTDQGIDVEVIKDIMTDTLEHNVFKMIDAISVKRKDLALEKLKDLISTGISPQVILANIITNSEAMLQVKELVSVGDRKEDIVAKTKLHSYTVSKNISNTRSYDVDIIKNILLKAYETDVTIKRGILPADFALELLIGNI